MPISITPTIPVISAQGAAPNLVLQPGTVVDAQVLKLLSADLVRIAIANLSIDVVSEVPLQAGQTLQLAVSQTDNGIRLAVVGQGAGAAAELSSSGLDSPGATLAPQSAVAVAVPGNALTPLERIAVTNATQIAATQQGSLAPLFANLNVVAGSGGLPPNLQQAVTQLLAQRTSLDQNLTGGDVKNAFQSSGLFLEASLASGSASTAAGIPDLKAALIVLRQTLVSSLGATPAVESPPTQATGTSQPVAPGTSNASATDTASSAHGATASTPVPPLSSAFDAQEVFLPRARLPIADDIVELDSIGRIVPPAMTLDPGSRASTIGAVLNLLQEALQEIPRQNGNASSAAPGDVHGDDVVIHTNTPPPPFRGALPSAQGIASPSIAPNAPLATTSHQLLSDTDAAIARQTLLQVASLPDRVDTAARIDTAGPRWSFEIPFVTPQGTAVTQFEIARDGGGNEVAAAKRVWRARFSLDVEPAGPVHALVSLSGERTSVRMWAERPATAARLRAGTAQLSQALSKAALQPGDIVIRDGAPTPSAPAPAGHFLDRAL
jgi:Flagellar hook-length control protein FliK